MVTEWYIESLSSNHITALPEDHENIGGKKTNMGEAGGKLGGEGGGGGGDGGGCDGVGRFDRVGRVFGYWMAHRMNLSPANTSH